MKRLLALVMVLCMVGVANAQSQMAMAPLEGDWAYEPGPRAGDPFIYSETTPSGYWAPVSTWGPFAGLADDIHLAKPQWMTGFDIPYIARVSANRGPLTATVNFYNMDIGENLLPGAIASYTITGLLTSDTYHNPPGQRVQVSKLAPQLLPADFWMEITFAGTWAPHIGPIVPDPFHPGIGLLIAGDDIAEAGLGSHDFMAAQTAKGVVGGYYWFGGYTPTLPPSDPNYNPMSNFLWSIEGIPEPMTLGLVALGGLLVVRRRR